MIFALNAKSMNSKANPFIWGVVIIAVVLPVVLAANSPLLQWRDPVYIIAGFAGVIAIALLLLQPLMAVSVLPGITRQRSLQIHRLIGPVLVLLVLLHVVGLWITSPPDVIDALLLRSATSFSIWGVVSMWAIFATALLAALRRRVRIKPSAWRIAHKALAVVIVITTVVHAVLIDGTMELITKIGLCFLLLVATCIAIFVK